MFVSKRFVSLSDSIIDCIPIVSSISNIAQALYKLARKVDAFNPAAPCKISLKRTLQIHILSKSSTSHFLASIPVLGNLCMLVKLVLEELRRKSFYGFEENPLKRAILLKDKELASLNLQNGELERSRSPYEILHLAGIVSNDEMLNLVLSARDWSVEDLLGVLEWISEPTDARPPPAPSIATILKYWKEKNKQADQKDAVKLVKVLNEVLKQNEVGLARQVIEILPNQTPFTYELGLIFREFGARQFYPWSNKIKNEALLNKGDREALIAKIGKPSYPILMQFFGNSFFDDEAEFETFYQLFEKMEELEPKDMKEAISYALEYNQTVGKVLFGKYQDRLSLDLKIELFKLLLSYEFDEEKAKTLTPKGLLSYKFNLNRAQALADFARQSSEQPLQKIASLYDSIITNGYADSLRAVGKEEDETILEAHLEAFKIQALAFLEDLAINSAT